MANVELTFFKESGKYYTSTTVPVADDLPLWQVFEQMAKHHENDDLYLGVAMPSQFNMLVDPVDHKNRHPALINRLGPRRTVYVRIDGRWCYEEEAKGPQYNTAIIRIPADAENVEAAICTAMHSYRNLLAKLNHCPQTTGENDV